MKKNIPLYLYGSIIILVGFFLFFFNDTHFSFFKLVLGVSLIVGSVFSFITALTRRRKQVQFAYHEMHALAMLVYGISIILFCNSFEILIYYTAFLFIFYAFSEIIFCNWLFNLSQKAVWKIVAIRALLGLAIGFGTIAAMNFIEYTLPVFGILFIMIGVNIILYIPVIESRKSMEVSKISENR